MAFMNSEKIIRNRTATMAVLPLLLASVLVGPSCATAAPAEEPAAETAEAAEAAAESVAEAEVTDLAAQWGVEVTSVRLTANDHMIDYRYRVLDADKAADLSARKIKPFLIHQESGKVLAVPETAKL